MRKAIRTRGSRADSTSARLARAALSAERHRLWLALALPLGMAFAAACGEDSGNKTDPNNVNAGAGGTIGNVGIGGSQGGSTPANPGTPGGSTPGGSGTPGGTPGAGSTGGGATGGGAQGGTTTGGTTMGGATTGGATMGGATMGGATMGGATMGGATAGGMTGGATTGGGMTGGGMPSNSDLKTKCQAGEQMGCRSTMSPSGMEVELGPYGAAMDVNVGKGFENTVNFLDNNSSCAAFAASFGQPKEANDKLLDLRGLDLKLYTVYRPAKWVEGETYPVVTWGNGTCAQPEGYATLLRYVASHGFIVVAPNSRYVGSGAEQKRGLDFLFKANQDSTSPYYKKVDTEHVAAMGHSQGSQSTINAASDARIKSVILFNVGQSASKPFFAISGDRDIAGPLSNYKSALASATKGAYLWMHMVPGNGSSDGHLTLMVQPERLTGATVAWLKYTLFGDAESKTWFAGATCKLCGHDQEYEFAAKGI